MGLTARDVLQAAVLLGALVSAYVGLRVSIARLLAEMRRIEAKLDSDTAAIQGILERLVRHEVLDDAVHEKVQRLELDAQGLATERKSGYERLSRVEGEQSRMYDASLARITKVDDEIMRLRDHEHRLTNEVSRLLAITEAMDRRLTKLINGGRLDVKP